ncbi:MAG: hypothetical protein JHC33_09350, partial [Ignisphaera sp.]|nr:hypothetical protein [Ignisphaera sp.]
EEDSTGEIIYMYIRHYFAEKAKKHLVYNDFTNKEASLYLLSHGVIGLKTVTPDFYPEHDRTDTDYDEYVLFSKDYIKIIDKTICRA